MRIAFLTSSYPQGQDLAAGPWLPPLAQELRHLGHEVVVFFPRLVPTVAPSAFEVPIEWSAEPRPLVSLSPTRPHDLTLVLRLLRRWQAAVAAAHEAQPFDVVLAVWAVPAGLVARRLRRRLNLPYVVWSLGSDINTYGERFGTRRIVRSILRDAGAVFANSRMLIGKIEALCGRGAHFLAASRPVEPPARLAQLPEAVNFVFIGRLERVKGPDVLLDAASRLAERTGGWHVTLVGDGSMGEELRERVRTVTQLSGRVTFTGHLTGERLLSYLYAADCIVIPSRSESLPIVLTEGLQAGRRFIASDVGDLAHFIDGYDLGEVVSKEDPTALAAAMGRFIEAGPTGEPVDPELLRLFDVESSASRFVEVASELVKPRL